MAAEPRLGVMALWLVAELVAQTAPKKSEESVTYGAYVQAMGHEEMLIQASETVGRARGA